MRLDAAARADFTPELRRQALARIPDPVAYRLPGRCAACNRRVWLFNLGWSDGSRSFMDHRCVTRRSA